MKVSIARAQAQKERSRRIARAAIPGLALRLTLVLQLALGLLIAAPAFAADVALTSNLKSYTSSPASSYLQMTLLNCAGIPRVLGGNVKGVAAQIYRPNSLGVVSSTVTPNDDITCGLTTGTSWYEFDVRVVQGPGLPDKTLFGATYCIHGNAPFVLESAVPCPTPPNPIFPSQIYYPVGTKNGVNLSFSLVPAPSPSSTPEIYLNGVVLDPLADYTLVGATLTMTALAPQAADSFFADYSTGGPPYQSPVIHYPAGAKNGVNLVYALDGPPQNSLAILVLLNGQALDPATDYSIAAGTLTMTSAPISTDALTGYY